MSGLINKVKEAVHSDKKDNAATNDPRSTNAGPHSSNIANAADPRVDSDRDNIHSTGGIGATGTHGTHGTHDTHAAHGGHGNTGVGSTGAGYGGPGNPQSGNAGPHSSNLANKADPRVDSDLDGGRNVGGAGGFGNTGTSGIGGAGHGATAHQSTTAGPHSSNLANKADPRVDSDLDGSRGLGGSGAGYQGTNTGAGYGGPGNPQSSNAGPHSSNLANRADPRVDSDLDGGRHAGLNTSGGGYGSHTGESGVGHSTTGHTGHAGAGGVGGAGAGAGYGSSATPGSGDASKTAGPHNSNLLNKLDPRVDSDMDGSKTYGGNQTHR